MLATATRTFGNRLVQHVAVRALTARYMSTLKQHIVVALGGNALLKRGEDMTMENQQKNIAEGVESLANILRDHNTVIVHGNGPQVGLLLLESAAYEKQTGLKQMKLDVLDAETEGMIGYMIEQEIQKHIGKDRGLVTVLSQIVTDPKDPAFLNPTKFVGPIYSKEEADKLGLPVKPDGDHFRRVVPSPLPVKLLDNEMKVVKQLVESDSIVICAGGGGIPVIEDPQSGEIKGVEAVIDKDRAATMMGISLGADGLLILTDVSAVCTEYGKPSERHIKQASPKALGELMGHFPPGSMGPKVESAIEFVTKTGGWAAIGSLKEADSILAGEAGTTVRGDLPEDSIEYFGADEGPILKSA